MKNTGIIISLLLLPVFTLNLKAQTLTATEIIQKADNKSRGKSSQGTMTLTIVRPDWKRSLTFTAWTKGRDYSLIYISAPAKEKGQVFLKRGKEMWNWMPSIERLIKIPPSMMMQSWMGSDFTNDDLVKESSIIHDYTHKLLGEELVRDQLCYKIELVPLPDAPVVWGKILTWVSKNGFDMWKAVYYDEDQQPVNTMNAYNLKQMGDRTILTTMEIIPANKKGNKTILQINNLVFDQPISDSFFTQQNMKKVR
ncbi:outer membrane lipoprotein-sorting protein [Parabacteroides sp. FAFU027]|uniref:outer membrane lipoprotein-sorting protein n=1 Tax=Parabacteroides sp. FAFU027 TaxID=2922715 RepID=UPI001FAED8B6|nr:outer membrane lipoprotein-sorting protein [Parabacteroides sp. FAFU027]